MTARSMILSDWQVRAALDGRLHQVRLPVVPQPSAELYWVGWLIGTTGNNKDIGKARWAKDCDGILLGKHLVRPPYAVGDTVIVKETWRCIEKVARLDNDCDGKKFYQYKADGFTCDTYGGYEAEQTKNFWEHGEIKDLPAESWRSPVTMPRWASRLSLTVTGVRVERVQEISEADAVAAGIPYEHWVGVAYHRTQYKNRWNSRYARRGYSWEDNVWCWVVQLEGGER